MKENIIDIPMKKSTPIGERLMTAGTKATEKVAQSLDATFIAHTKKQTATSKVGNYVFVVCLSTAIGAGFLGLLKAAFGAL